MPFLNHRLRTLQTESFRNLGAAFSPSLFLFLSLNFVPKYLKISFLPLCIYKNVEKNRAKTGHFLLQFLPSNHNILWYNMPIFLIFHNTASELPTPHAPPFGTYLPAPHRLPLTHRRIPFPRQRPYKNPLPVFFSILTCKCPPFRDLSEMKDTRRASGSVFKKKGRKKQVHFPC